MEGKRDRLPEVPAVGGKAGGETMSLTLRQRVASFQLSYSMAMAAQLKKKEKPKTAIWNRLNQLEDYLGRTLDHYRIEKFSIPDLDRASKLFRKLDQEISVLYPTNAKKRQIRRQKRNNQASIHPPVRRSHR